MAVLKVLSWIKPGVHTFANAAISFYCSASLVTISLIPSILRAYQMWHRLETPLWMEFAVEAARIALFLLIIAILTNSAVSELFRKAFWARLFTDSSIKFRKRWPHVFLSQLASFIVLLYGLMNLLIVLIVALSVTHLIGILDIRESSREPANLAMVFFLKNMSVIPISMIYILIMCGVGTLRR